MIDRTQLTEALARWEGWQMGDPYDPGTLDTILPAARWARDFPTDEQVEAAASELADADTVLLSDAPDLYLSLARRVLEAVTMIGE